MINLLTETLRELESAGKSENDIVFIGSIESGHECTWPQFKRLADKDYHNGYGSNQVVSDLLIAFSDGSTMTRAEYDGSEWWDYNPIFKRPDVKKPIKKLFLKNYEGNLAELNDV